MTADTCIPLEDMCPFSAIHWRYIGTVEGTHILKWNASICCHTSHSHRVHWSRAVPHPLRWAVIERNMGAVVGAFISIGNTSISRFATHGVNPSRAVHHPFPAIHWRYIG